MIAIRLAAGTILLACFLSVGCDNSQLPNNRKSSPAPTAFKAVKPSEPIAKAEPLVKVTPRATGIIRKIITEQGLMDTCYLRLRVVPGGCCGFMHKLDLDPETTAEDYIFESGGIKVVVFNRQIEMLRGSLVDYGQENDKRGFKVQNPNFEGKAAKKWLPLLNAEVEPTPKNAPTQLREKIVQFQKMTKEDPENELAHYRLGQLLMEDEQYAEAARSFERTVELSPDFLKAYQLLGECLVKLDQKNRAIAILTKGWAAADRRGDDASRKTMATLLAELGTAVPLELPRSRSN